MQPTGLEAALAAAHNHIACQRPAEAAALAQGLLLAAPGHAGVLATLGVALGLMGQTARAVEMLRGALAAEPQVAGHWVNLGTIFGRDHRFAAAADCCRKAIALDPGIAEAHCNLANSLIELGQPAEALPEALTAIRLRHDYAPAHHNAGVALEKLDRPVEAIHAYRAALGIEPGLAEAWNNLGICLQKLGHHAEADEAFVKAIVLQPNPQYLSNRLLGLLYREDMTAEGVFSAHRDTAPALRPPAATRWRKRPADRGGRLRIGYLSADFRTHSVSFFFEPLLAEHDRDRFEVCCYYGNSIGDETTRRLKSLSEHWVDCGETVHGDLVERLRADRLDVLVDLAGHTAGSRLPAFAARAAPVQVSYLGYPASTGLAEMDWRLTDEWADPPGAEAWHSERLWRLPRTYFAYRPPPAPEVSPLPSAAAGAITFGCFNNFSKLGAGLLGTWAELLSELPNSRLLLKNQALNDPAVLEGVARFFAERGIDPGRLRMGGWEKEETNHLARYAEVDVALDTFPYNGATTSCEALWMGVPVVSLAGRAHAGRMGASLLHAAGLDELVATSAGDYVATARSLALDEARRASLRRTMRDRLAASPMLDGGGLARAIEAAYEGMVAAHRQRRL